MTLFLGGRGEGEGTRGRAFRRTPSLQVAFTQYEAGFVSTSKNSAVFLLTDFYFCDILLVEAKRVLLNVILD